MKSTEHLWKNYTKSLQTFQRIEVDSIFPNSYYEASITVILKPGNNITKGNYREVSHKLICKNSQQNFTNDFLLVYTNAKQISAYEFCIL